MEAREVHSSGRRGIGRQAARGWEGGRDGNNTNCRSGERARLIDGVEPRRDWALTDDVSAAIDWCRRPPVLLKHSPTAGATLNSFFCGFFLFLASFYLHICILEWLDVPVFQERSLSLDSCVQKSPCLSLNVQSRPRKWNNTKNCHIAVISSTVQHWGCDRLLVSASFCHY